MRTFISRHGFTLVYAGLGLIFAMVVGATLALGAVVHEVAPNSPVSELVR